MGEVPLLRFRVHSRDKRGHGWPMVGLVSSVCSGMWSRGPGCPGLTAPRSVLRGRLRAFLYTSLFTGELNAIRKHKCFLCSPLYVKGVSLGYVGRIKT
jgi:hypothetical protein